MKMTLDPEAKALVALAFRNGPIDVHAGTGDQETCARQKAHRVSRLAIHI
jgi:hypothetical protein